MSPLKVPVLLVLNGVVIAAHTLMARAAYQAGVSPMVYALASAAGAAAFLLGIRVLQGRGLALSRAETVYGLVAGLISIAIPQTLIYSASAYVSAGVASLAFAFPTPFTYILAALFGLERMSLGRTVGVAIAFAGAAGLAIARSAGIGGDAAWIILAMLAPVAIAAGNIYRARFWPEGSGPMDLALAMSASGALWLALGLALPFALGFGPGFAVAGETPVGALGPKGLAFLAAAAVLASFGNVIYFELQRSGGIVSFSQIGYVGAVLGLLGGALILGEPYGTATWVAAAVVAAGVIVSEVFKRRDGAASP